MKLYRNLSGIYFREKIGEKFENICFEELSEEKKLEILSKNKNHDWKNSMILRLSKVINEMGEV